MGGWSRLSVSVTVPMTAARWVGLVMASVKASGSPACVISMYTMNDAPIRMKKAAIRRRAM